MTYSGEMKKFAEWIKKNISAITEVSFNASPSSKEGRISARLIFQSDEPDNIGKHYRKVNLILRLSSSNEDWEQVLNIAQVLQNNLIREREYDIRFEGLENPDGPESEGEEFKVDLQVILSVSTGKINE